MCKAQNFTCKICKKIGHFTSICKAPMLERRSTRLDKTTEKHTTTKHPTNKKSSTCERTRKVRRRRGNRRGNSSCRSRTLHKRISGRLVISEHNNTSGTEENKQHIV